MKRNYQNENFDEYNINYDENIIQDLQYTNSLLNNRNIYLEKELETIKNKYNLCIQDLNDINKHISICKNNQDKIIKDLKERNNYLEKLYISKNNENKNITKENEDFSEEKKILEKYHLFIGKMKILFKYEQEENLNDEDYLDILANNIIKINEEFLLCKNELNKKIHEINKLKHENQNLKSNNINYSIPKEYMRVKTPVGHYKDKLKFNTKNNQIDKSNSPKSLRNKKENNIPIPKTPQLDLKKFIDINNNNDMNLKRRKNNQINLDKKLINSHSLNSYKFKTLKESERGKNILYQNEININENKNQNADDVLQTLMNNIKHLENTINTRPNQNIKSKY